MTATNHALTGATIGLIVGNPLIALPAAFLSHFVCDVIPHFGGIVNDDSWIKSKTFRNMLFVDALACIVLVSMLAGLHPNHWFLASVCAFLATSPDLAWINRFIKAKRHKKWRPSLFAKFAGGIQWFQRPIGAFVEAAWFASGVFIIATIIH